MKNVAFLVEKRNGQVKLVMVQVKDEHGAIEEMERKIAAKLDVYKVDELATFDNYCFGTDGI